MDLNLGGVLQKTSKNNVPKLSNSNEILPGIQRTPDCCSKVQNGRSSSLTKLPQQSSPEQRVCHLWVHSMPVMLRQCRHTEALQIGDDPILFASFEERSLCFVMMDQRPAIGHWTLGHQKLNCMQQGTFLASPALNYISSWRLSWHLPSKIPKLPPFAKTLEPPHSKILKASANSCQNHPSFSKIIPIF